MVKGSLTLISGEPGIGKSTIIMQAAANIAKIPALSLRFWGRVRGTNKMRADRICPDLSESLFFLAETNMENIAEVSRQLNPVFMIIDSIQTMHTEEMDSAPGSVSQVRACGNELMRIGKQKTSPSSSWRMSPRQANWQGPKSWSIL
jgi:DNA repair protein RadA/Sms